jgi:DNA repair exonuclease SbcCD nuclease subunit
MIKIFSDPHIGCTRSSHTTTASREKLKEHLYSSAIQQVTFDNDDFVVCCGDMFDTYWSDSRSLQLGMEVYHGCDLVLEGNHDHANRMNTDSSLSFLKKLNSHVRNEANQPKVNYEFHKGITMQVIHHKFTQDLFDEALSKVVDGDILFLHCNYNSGYAKDDASLNLTKEQAEILLTKVKLIFIGHEHAYSEHFGGRLILTGNTHPTSFSDISDKYSWSVDQDLNVTKKLIWDAKKNSIKFDYKSLFEDIYLDGYQFIEITGVAERSELPAIARAVSNLWKTYSTALMIKNSVVCEKQEVKVAETTKFVDSLAQVTSELHDTKLKEIWEYYMEKLSETD